MKTEFTADDRSKKYKACKLGVAVAKVNQGDGPMCGRPEAYTQVPQSSENASE